MISCYLQPQPQQHQQGADDSLAVAAAAAAAAGPASLGQAAGEAQQPAQPLVLHLSVTTCAVLQRLQLQGTAVRPVPDQGHWVLDFGELLPLVSSCSACIPLRWNSNHLLISLVCCSGQTYKFILPPCSVQGCLWACLRQPGSGLSPQLQALARVHKHFVSACRQLGCWGEVSAGSHNSQ